jgi:hypothetical protein
LIYYSLPRNAVENRTEELIMTANLAKAVMMLDAEGSTDHLRDFYMAHSYGLKHFAWSISDSFPLDDAELVHLIRVFIRLENATNIEGGMGGSFCGGSTTAVPRLLSELAFQNPSLSEEMIQWAFHTTKNPYVPFGTCNRYRYTAHSVSDYLKLNTARLVANYGADTRRSEKANQLAAKRAADHADCMRLQQERKQRRAEHLGRVARLDPTQRVADLLVRRDCAPDYYPREWANIAAAKALSIEQQIDLVERLTHAKRGPWKVLKKTLIIHLNTLRIEPI